jgi:hypothetical protein
MRVYPKTTIPFSEAEEATIQIELTTRHPHFENQATREQGLRSSLKNHQRINL